MDVVDLAISMGSTFRPNDNMLCAAIEDSVEIDVDRRDGGVHGYMGHTSEFPMHDSMTLFRLQCYISRFKECDFLLTRVRTCVAKRPRE